MQHPRRRTVFSRLVSAVPAAASLTILCSIAAPTSTQTAIANGDTRTINLFHAHRKDSISVTFRRNGSYDSSGLQQLNYFLRDWRNDQQASMDPRLFDVIWEAQRGADGTAPVIVLSAYRSPTTNAMLRSRSRAVAKESLHMHGKAMDMRMPDANMQRVREVALRMQRGGVGWYGGSNFVHLDVGSVRAWPRLSYDHLARLFPDGRSVHISSDNRVLPGYEEARAIVASRGGDYVPTLAQVKEKSFLARLFGFEEDDEAEVRPARTAARGRTFASAPAAAPAPAMDESSSPAAFFRADNNRRTGGSPAPVQVAAAPVPVRTEAPAQPVRAEPVAAVPATRALEEAPATPLPPRRPPQEQIAALIEKAEPAAPLPPMRPDSLRPVAIAAVAGTDQPSSAAPLPPLRTAAIRTASILPNVITRGAPVTTNAPAGTSAPVAGLLAYAPGIEPSADENARKAAQRRTGAGRSAPALGRTVGVRSARSDGEMLVAARLDRSNFTSLTNGRRISEQTMGSSVGSSVGPLRAAARQDPSRLLFAPADMPAQGFTANLNPVRADLFSQQVQRQASNLPVTAGLTAN